MNENKPALSKEEKENIERITLQKRARLVDEIITKLLPFDSDERSTVVTTVAKFFDVYMYRD